MEVYTVINEYGQVVLQVRECGEGV